MKSTATNPPVSKVVSKASKAKKSLDLGPSHETQQSIGVVKQSKFYANTAASNKM
jgi:hypothetical protein